MEGADHPVLVWTDHKNLSHLQSAKRLNPRQSCCSMLFSRYNLFISYCPGSKNIKPDALSRFHSPDSERELATILPLRCTISSVTWEIEDLIRQAQQTEPDPGTFPHKTIYVPTSVRARLIHWIHSAKFSVHSRISCTIALINPRFSWPSIHKRVKEFVIACFCLR